MERILEAQSVNSGSQTAGSRRQRPAEKRPARVMMIGCGPHARRIYLPALRDLDSVELAAVVELDSTARETLEKVEQYFANPQFVFTEPFAPAHVMPGELRDRLDHLVAMLDINGVIITTEPLSHMAYSAWASAKGLHLLMDKPISLYEDISHSPASARQLLSDYSELARLRDGGKAFIVNAQRRYHPGFEVVKEAVEEISGKYGIPITSMQNAHCDGQWRLPYEIVTQDYHPYNRGYGKLAHSGYHIVDVAAWLLSSSFSAARKTFDGISAFTKFIFPDALLHQQNRDDYLRVFGSEYETVNPYTDAELQTEYAGYGEVDMSSVIGIQSGGTDIAGLTINLSHNGFSRRNWILPGEDLYKGNGRVKHEYHNIEQGPYQNVQIHSYQSSDRHETLEGMGPAGQALGENNHFDIYIFRNSGVTGGKPLEVIRSGDFRKVGREAASGLVTESVKHRVVQEFAEAIIGQRPVQETASDLSSHALTSALMSAIYEAGTTHSYITRKFTI